VYQEYHCEQHQVRFSMNAYPIGQFASNSKFIDQQTPILLDKSFLAQSDIQALVK